MRKSQHFMKPQDIVVLLKIIVLNDEFWRQIPLAHTLKLSQSEISQSVARSKYAGLIDDSGKNVMRATLKDFLQYGVAVVFPAKPGPVVRGIPTAHSAQPLKSEIKGSEAYVWPYSKGHVRGHSVTPFYPKVPLAALEDEKLYRSLALIDALRVGRARERKLALIELERIIGT